MVKCVIKISFVCVLLIGIFGCGDPGGMGNTVTVSASAKDGASTIISIDTDDANLTTQAQVFAYNIKSTAYTGMTGLPVDITSVTFSYQLISAPVGANLTSINLHSVATYAMAIHLNAGDDADYENVPVLLATPTGFGVAAADLGQYQYRVTAVFHGKESSGKSITTNPVNTNIIITVD